MTSRTKRRRWIPRRYTWPGLLALILASNLVRCQHGERATPGPGQQAITMPSFEGDRFDEGRVEVAFRDLQPADETGTATIMLIHGIPRRTRDLEGLVSHLSPSFRIIAPDLPGFGNSTRRLPDYSFNAQAAYLDHMIQALGLSNLHVVAYSQGGGIALELAQRAPDRIASMILISSIGVQEFELLGIYGLNRAIHGVQLAGLTGAATILPHFGWLDTMMFNTSYARNFYDSDLRPMRDYLKNLAAPTLLIHGRDDVWVPPGTAQESNRLVPQSELVMKRGSHSLVARHAEAIAARITAFIGQVERGEARTRETADPARAARAEQPFDPADVDKAVGVAMVVMILLIAFATFLSEDLACIGAGLLVTQGVIDFPTAVAGAFLGIFVGDLLLFWVGHHWGKAALRKAPLKWMITETALRDSAKWFARKGPVVVLLSRFVPGSRLPTFITAGMLHTRFWIFFVFFIVAGLVWAPMLVWLSMKIGQQIITALFAYKLYTLAAIGVAALALWLLFRIVIPLFSFKGRRMLFSRWRRLTRWEYWPSWLLYPPVLANILFLGVRYRSLTLFTAANPAIPLGGFIGESKKTILDGLKTRRDLVAHYDLIPANMPAREKELAVISFLDRHGFSLPVVLKPDAGQRGTGVKIARNISAVADYFATTRPATIVQEYVPGFEFGVFYYRIPGQPRGHIFSITEKRFPSVVGDGKHDIAYLILKDPRTVGMAPYYLRLWDERRDLVPAEEEIVPLVELGTHCRGAAFHDGRWIKTLELERAIDELSQGFKNFYFGRYDLRTDSLDDLRAGKGFKVIELNGVTSESTNIYDPGNGLADAYAVLNRQWRIAFKIGDRNRRLGVRPAPLRELLNALGDYDSAPEV